jgi:caffeoyl-CoA O-methyltransferase
VYQPKSVAVTPALHHYLVAHGSAPDAVQRDLIERTWALGEIGGMQIAPEQGALLTLLTRLVNARYAIEVGTFTGYSSLCIAYGLPKDGHLLCCDINAEWTSIAREAWQAAGVADRIELRLAPALNTLRALPPDPVIDLAFLDADKSGYRSYAEELLPRIRPGGLLLVDNVLWGGSVVDETVQDADTAAIREFNRWLATDERVEVVMLPIADGLTLARRQD